MLEQSKSKKQYGKAFEFDKTYFIDPIKFDDIYIYQLGEVCFESGHTIKDHTQICHEITYILSGGGQVCCKDKCFNVKGGDIILNYIGETHSIKANDDSKLRYFYLGFLFNEDSDNEIIKCLAKFYSSKVKLNKKNDNFKLVQFFINLLDEFYTKQEFSCEITKTYILQILVYIYRYFNKDNDKNIIKGLKNDEFETGKTVYSVIKYIDINLLNIKNLTEISDELGYSYNYLSHLFKNKMGISIQSYINNEKIELSKKLIKDNKMTITQVASTLNYQTVQAYSKAFKKICKISPRDYKQSE